MKLAYMTPASRIDSKRILSGGFSFLLLFLLGQPLFGLAGGNLQGLYRPSIANVSATATDNTIALTARIGPLSNITQARVEYGVDMNSYGGTNWTSSGVLSVPVEGAPSGSTNGTYTITFVISRLVPGQTYFYRVIADNRGYFTPAVTGGTIIDSDGNPVILGGRTTTQGIAIMTTGITPPRSFAQWRSATFTSAELANNAISGPNACPNGSNPCNLLRFYLGFPPSKNPDSKYLSNLPRLQVISDEGVSYIRLQFTRIIDPIGTSSLIETSSDGIYWDTVTADTQTQFSPSGFVEEVSVDLGTMPTSELSRAFYRLRVEN